MFDVNSQILGEAIGRREASKTWAVYVAELQAQIDSLHTALEQANERFVATQAHHHAVRAVLEALPAETVDQALQVYKPVMLQQAVASGIQPEAATEYAASGLQKIRPRRSSGS